MKGKDQFTVVIIALVIVIGAIFAAAVLQVIIQKPEQKSETPLPAVFSSDNAAAEQAALKVKIAAALDAAEPTIHVESYTNEWNKYGDLEVSGTIHNKGNTDKEVFGYVDFYTKDGVKEDSAIWSSKPDANGKATFKTTGRDITPGGTYEVRITNVYDN